MRTKDYGLTKDERGIWHCDFYATGGRRFQRSTRTADRAAATEYCSSLEAGEWRTTKLGEKPTLIWKDAVVKWTADKTRDGNRDLANDADKARILEPFLEEKWMHELTEDACNAALIALATERKWANPTYNRYASFIMRVVNHTRLHYKAKELKLQKRSENEEDGEVRYLTKEEAARLIAELPLHLKRMVEFSILTGLRQSNVTGLLWRWVDLKRGVISFPAAAMKAKKNFKVKLSPRALQIVIEARDCDKHANKQVVFSYFGELIEYPAESAWTKALERAEIVDFHWHCLRHTWASWQVMGWLDPNGRPTPLAVLQQLGGWASYEMVQRYAHLATDYTDEYVGGVSITPAVLDGSNVVPLNRAAGG